MDRVEAGIRAAAGELSTAGRRDGRDRHLHHRLAPQARHPRRSRSTAARCASAAWRRAPGMIRPDLGTMIAIITTDAAIAAHQLQPLLGAAAARSFNRITVDGSQSTSDSVIVLASGASGVTITEAELRGVQRGAARRLPRPRDGDRVRRRGRPPDRPLRGRRRPLGGRCRPRRAPRGRGPAGALRAVRRRPELGPHRGRAGRLRRRPRHRPHRHRPGRRPARARRHRRCGRRGSGRRGGARRAEVHVRIDLASGPASAVIYGSDLSTQYVLNNSEYTT